ncbi:MAG TPA: cobalamin B12-binding domain-containing protein [Steroidobacteraceae bacterium]|nr:cobalamin B12-binding domain-containing protein [Steroidobacteraceae bacterium]
MVDATLWDGAERSAMERACAPRSGREPVGTGMGGLLRTIETEIIPRLVLALQSAPGPGALDGLARSATGPEEVTEFARLVVAHDVAVASVYLRELLNRGVSLEKLYLELLAPAARLLGEWWKQDLRDFTEVTTGLCRMHQLLHEFSSAFQQDAQPTRPDRSVLLMPMPGEQHSFGLIMVAEFFRRGGWDVWDRHPSTLMDVLQIARRHWFNVIGVSLSCESRLEELAPLVMQVRRESRNPGVAVMVGGQPFINHPERVVAAGADATAADGRRATSEATRLAAARQRVT